MFTSYDIRGKYNITLDESLIFKIGYALIVKIKIFQKENINFFINNTDTIFVDVAYDLRHSSPNLAKYIHLGVTAAGGLVNNLGVIPTPILYYISHCDEIRNNDRKMSSQRNSAVSLPIIENTVQGMKNLHLKNNIEFKEKPISSAHIMITASHNSEEWNGLKILLFNQILNGKEIAEMVKKYGPKEEIWTKYCIENTPNQIDGVCNISSLKACHSDYFKNFYIENYIADTFAILDNFSCKISSYEISAAQYDCQSISISNDPNCSYNFKKSYKEKNILKKDPLSILWSMGKSAASSIIDQFISTAEENFPGSFKNVVIRDQGCYSYNPDIAKNKEKMLEHNCALCISFDGDGDRLMLHYRHGALSLPLAAHSSQYGDEEFDVDVHRVSTYDIARFIMDELAILSHLSPQNKILYDTNVPNAFRNYIREKYPVIEAKFCSNGHSIIKKMMIEDSCIFLAIEDSGHTYLKRKVASKWAIYDDPFVIVVLFLSALEKLNRFGEDGCIYFDNVDSSVGWNIENKRRRNKEKYFVLRDNILIPDKINEVSKENFISSIIKNKINSYFARSTINIDHKEKLGVRISNGEMWFNIRFSQTESILRITVENKNNVEGKVILDDLKADVIAWINSYEE